MRRPALLAATFAAAACALSVVAATQASAPGAVDVPGNRVSTGALHLDLSGGRAQAQLSFANLMPGGTYARQVWLAVNDPTSVVAGAVTVRLDQVRDTPGSCDVSRDKALAEQASGIAGCTVRGNEASGTPVRGNLSRLLHLDVRSSAPGDGCADADPSALGTGSATVHSLDGETLRLRADGRAPVLAPGVGLCLAVSLQWPAGLATDVASPEHPLDNAAQGDSLSLRAVFSIVQVGT